MMGDVASKLDTEELEQIALKKMTPVLGAAAARGLMTRVLAEQRIALATPQDLYAFGQALSRLDGFEGAVGALVCVAAVMRGATPVQKSAR